MKKQLAKLIALILCAVLAGQSAGAAMLADELLPGKRYFDDSVVSDSERSQKLFLFGSRKMTVSEKSKDHYIMKVIRTGDCSDEACVTVKFTDISANYGENYVILDDAGRRTEVNEDRISFVDFLRENEDTQEELEALSSSEMRELVEKYGGYETLDADGMPLTDVSFGNESGDSELDIDSLLAPQSITSDSSGTISDAFPGTEVKLSFGANETEKQITVIPKYSDKAEGDCLVAVTLKDPSGGFAVSEDSFSEYITITDEDEGEKAVVSIEKAEYTAEADSVEVVVKRSGSINQMVSVDICTVSDTAEIGEDFQGIDAPLYFPMGIESRTVEIPVNHSEEELDFDVKLVNPMNCDTEASEATVHITAASSSEEKGTTNGSKYDAYLAPKIAPSDISGFGNFNNTDGSVFTYSCKDVDYDTWNGGRVFLDNPYLYDGARITWSARHDFFGSKCYTYVNTDDRHDYFTDENEWDKRTDYIMFANDSNDAYPNNKELWFGSLTSLGFGIQVTVNSLNLIYRTFNFTLADADPMSFAGVDDVTAKTFSAMNFDGELPTTRTVNSSVGGGFTVTAPKSQVEYLHLDGLLFLDGNGNELYYQKNNSNTRSVSVELTKELMSKLAVSTLKYDRQQDGRYIGNITVKPVFSYIDAEVTVKPSAYGTFAGDYKTGNTNLTLSYHIGDRLTLSSEVSSAYEGKYVADGVIYERRDREGKLVVGGSGQLYYDADGKIVLTVDDPQLSITPAFRENDNAVRVKVLKSDVDGGAFDTSKGLFAINYGVAEENGYYVYTVSSRSVHLDQLVSVTAVPSDGGKVSTWTIPGETQNYAGNTFYFSAARDKENNIITLSTAKAQNITFTGYVMNADKNLSTGRTSDSFIVPATGALVCAGDQYAMAGEDGSFSVSAVGAKGSAFRLMIYNNNVSTFKNVYVSGGSNNVGVISAAVNSADSSYFTNVYCYQNDGLVTNAETLALNGKKLTLYATVQDGNKYIVNGTQYTENVTGVTFYVLDGTTNEIKSVFPATEVSDGVYAAEIERFTPENPDSFYYGDCFYVSMTTDRIHGNVKDDSGNTPEEFLKTEYAMLSTGYEIVRDGNYEPQMINFTLPVSAAQVLTASEGTETGGTKAYASFPFIGSIDTVIGVKGILKLATGKNYTDGEYGDEDAENPVGTSYKRAQFRITMSFENLPYGGTRMKFGVTAVTGNEAWSTSAEYNPIETFDFLSGHSSGSGKNGRGLIHDNRAGVSNIDTIRANVGNPRMTLSVSLGFYIDFGIITTTDGTTGKTTGITESEWVFLGAGGYLGGDFTVKFQWFTLVPPLNVPGYAGVVGDINVNGYLGASKDPEKVLKYSDMVDADGNYDVDNLHFNVDVIANASLKGFIGVGVPDVVGARILLGANVNFTYSPFLENYFTELENSWGLGVNLTVGGQIDLIVTKIPVDGFSVPIYSAGFTDYFVVLKRANKLVAYTRQELTAKGENYSDAVKEKVEKLTEALENGINGQAKEEQLRNDFNALLDYVYDEINLISGKEYALLYAITPYDVFLTEPETEKGNSYETIGHTDSSFVANRPVLMGGYSQVSSKAIVHNSYSQPAAKITDIGGGRILSVFLMDTSAEGEVVEPTVVYTVYDANDNTWTEPAAIQNDGTVDYTPSVCDAGDKVLVTWASAKKPYEEYTSPTVMMQELDIYAAFIDKATGTASAPDKLTDDEYMDYKPSAIYDSESGNIAVYYLKNDVRSDDISEYLTSESLLCYRLMENGEWITKYYQNEYPTYTAQQLDAMSEQYGGQRFVSSASVDGRELPITDMTVCEGYNGLGVYAFTVDTDGDTSTDADTEMFLRVFDFRDYKTYKPIRITKDDIPQAMPQLIRNNVPYVEKYEENGKTVEETVEGSTYLFWLEDENQIKYISVTDLIRHGIYDDEGKLRDDGNLNENYYVDPVCINTDIGEGTSSAVSSYRALTDNSDNLYIIWTQATGEVENGDINSPAALEIYAAAKIKETPDSPYDAASDTGGATGSSWSEPYQLTGSGSCNDGVYGTVTENGMLYIMHNRYSVYYVGDTEEYLSANSVDENGYMSGNPYEISGTDLMLTTFEPVGTVEATEFTFSDEMPTAGETVSVSAKIENTGLTTAKGYSAEFYAGDELVYETSSDRMITANSCDHVSFDWTVPQNFDGLSIRCVARENGYSNEKETFSAPLSARAEYGVTVTGVRQIGDRFVAEYVIENIGNAPSKNGDRVNIEFDALYGDAKKVYGLDDTMLASEPVSLDAGESRAYTTELIIPASAFDYCGYDQLLFSVTDGDGNELSDLKKEFVQLTEPMNAKFTCGESLKLTVGDETKLSVDIGSRFLERGSGVVYYSDDTSVVTVTEDGTLVATGKGTATVTAYITPSGKEIKLTVKVYGKGEMTFDDVAMDAYYYDAVLWALKNKVTEGVSSVSFAPDASCTRAQMVTFLWRAAGSPEPETVSAFEDILTDTWYTKAVSWAAESGITNGVGDNRFAPDAILTRAETVTFLYRFADPDKPNAAAMFDDVNEQDFFYAPVAWAAEQGVTNGVGDNRFVPYDVCTRGQIVTMLYRFFVQ